tara:strand:+ start:62 stop:451 length:390 start_codon:yes stop_codon:yes gene_type:complete
MSSSNENADTDRNNQKEKENMPVVINNEMVSNLSFYEMVKECVDDDGFYDGSDEELCPIQFDLSDFQHPDTEVELLLQVWHGYVPSITCYLDKGFIYFVKAYGLVYEIFINENMGLGSICPIGTEEEVE